MLLFNYPREGRLWGRPIPTKPRSRSVPDVAVLNSQPRFPAELLIKYQRLPRGFFWNRSLPLLLFGYSINRIVFCHRYPYLNIFKIIFCYCEFKIGFKRIRLYICSISSFKNKSYISLDNSYHIFSFLS